MSLFDPYNGFATVVKLDYGHPEPEHSLILVPDRWDDLVGLLAVPYEFLRKARQSFTIDSSASDHYWDVFGPLTIILDPLTVPSRSSVEGLRTIALAVERRSKPHEDYQPMADGIRALLPSWQWKGHADWRSELLSLCVPQSTDSKSSCPGFFLVEYAFVTRTMIVRYIPPSTPTNHFVDNITPITFSDFLVNLQNGVPPVSPSPRQAFMHFDLKSATDPNYTSLNVATMKAQFAADYITSSTVLLEAVAYMSKGRIDKSGQQMPDYLYTAAEFVRNKQSAKAVSIQQPTDANSIYLGINNSPLLSNGLEPIFERINGDFDPTVILESVDPWASDWVWTHRPCENPYNIDGRFPMDGKHQDFPHVTSNGDPSPQPCALIYVTFADGSGRWVIDPSSLLLKNYFAPTIPE